MSLEVPAGETLRILATEKDSPRECDQGEGMNTAPSRLWSGP
jgi:hypothetical protein